MGFTAKDREVDSERLSYYRDPLRGNMPSATRRNGAPEEAATSDSICSVILYFLSMEGG